MAIDIVDREGCIAKEEMRKHFEAAIKQTKALQANTSLSAFEINGRFSHYTDPDTDTMWIGFAIGMRCSERLNRAAQAASQEPLPGSGNAALAAISEPLGALADAAIGPMGGVDYTQPLVDQIERIVKSWFVPASQEWRDTLTVNLLRHSHGLTKTQIRELIDAAVSGRSPDESLFTPTSQERVKCDGNHSGPRCADPECWNDDAPASQEQAVYCTTPYCRDNTSGVCTGPCSRIAASQEQAQQPGGDNLNCKSVRKRLAVQQPSEPGACPSDSAKSDQQTVLSISDAVQVCPLKDSVCGDRRANWCGECPKRKQPDHVPDAGKMMQQSSGGEVVGYLLDDGKTFETERQPYHDGPEWTPLTLATPKPEPMTEAMPQDVGHTTIMGDCIYAGIFEDEISEVKSAVVIKFESDDKLRDFLRWHHGITKGEA